LDYALGEIRRMGAEFDLPEPELEEAARLYRTARTAGSITGRSVEGFVTACLLAAIRRSSRPIPVSERELRTVTRADRDQIRTARGALTVELDIEIPPIEAAAFLPRAASELSMPKPVERSAKTLLDAYTNGDGAHHGTSPRTLAAAAAHAAYDGQECNERPTLQALSDVFNVARSTISSQKNSVLRAVDDDV
jgi:transcription initiation factor TFIIB